MPASSIYTPLRLVALFTRAWIEILKTSYAASIDEVALFTRAWIEIICFGNSFPSTSSPFSRGRGLKSQAVIALMRYGEVALFTRAWIEIDSQ